jgi:glutaredoxin
VASAILYGKPDCHLCDDAAAILDGLARRDGLTWRRVDITQDPDLFARYRYTIPVIEIVGGPALGWPTTLERVRRALLASRADA